MNKLISALFIVALSACVSPDTDSIKKFAAGVDSMADGVEASYDRVNTLQVETVMIQSARTHALWKETPAEEAPTVVLTPDITPLLTKEML